MESKYNETMIMSIWLSWEFPDDGAGRENPERAQWIPLTEEKLLGVQGGKRWLEFSGESTGEETERIPEISEGPLGTQQGPDQHRHKGKLSKAGEKTIQKD